MQIDLFGLDLVGLHFASDPKRLTAEGMGKQTQAQTVKHTLMLRSEGLTRQNEIENALFHCIPSYHERSQCLKEIIWLFVWQHLLNF